MIDHNGWNTYTISLLVGFVVVASGFSFLFSWVWEKYFPERPVTIDQFGLIEGEPTSAECERCGSKCLRMGKYLSSQEMIGVDVKPGTLFTEWACPKCVRGEK